MTLLTTKGLEAFYGDFQALFGIDFDVREGESIAIIGANGAGKSTFLKTICGQLSAPRDAVVLAGEPIGGRAPNDIVSRGIAMVPEGRRLFSSLSVEENLVTGTFSGRRGSWNLERVYELFPVLKEKRRQRGTTLSGGQQQMVAIGRALMANPRVLICDEISLGLAPVVVKDIYDAFPKIMEEGLSVIIVEQDIDTALRVSDRVYCFMHGQVSLAGKPVDLRREQISNAYFGI
ncbi:ABC transporter ATP-binding protein [Herbaspirillum huttiense]|uniref:ABC transporter ATP-binding protein n=1 Tax=Herbaspirillum huttiense TaxID=863372 RepID=UPI001065230D|nr:ABC transporter ATP-binding protein [Herbaspirillum huttiense]QBP77686.1 ABC transporter ATP-binding protein [Herbaspirillum huttiense]